MCSHKRIIIIFMLHPRAARGPLKLVHLSRELQWWQEPNTTHLLQNTSHLRRRPSQAKEIRGIIGHTLLLYRLRVVQDKTTRRHHLIINHVSIATRLVIGRGSALTPRRTIRSQQLQMHARGMCITPPWKRFPLERLSQLVCFL